MINLLRSEWIKFRSVRSTLIVLAVAGALVVLVAVLVANNVGDDTTSACQSDGVTVSDPGFGPCPVGQERVELPKEVNLTDLTAGVNIAAILFGVLGVQVIGQEYRFNTIRPTFTAVPHRLRVMVAKLLVACSACAVVSVVMLAVSWLVGKAMVDNFVVDGIDQHAALGTVIFTVLFTALGMAIGAIVRQPIAAIPILLGEAFVVESILAGVITSSQRWLPFVNGIQMTVRVSEESDFRSPLSGGLYLAAVVVALWALGAYLVNKRDA